MSLDKLIAQLREYADALDRANVHDDIGLSMTHSYAAEAMRSAADNWPRQSKPAALPVPEAPQDERRSLTLTADQIEQVMNALEGWDGKDTEADTSTRKAAFEMIQDAYDNPAALASRPPAPQEVPSPPAHVQDEQPWNERDHP